jgi:hypothetical protein
MVKGVRPCRDLSTPDIDIKISRVILPDTAHYNNLHPNWLQ